MPSDPENNWGGPKIIGSYFYVGRLGLGTQNWNTFGPTPQAARVNAAEVCQDGKRVANPLAQVLPRRRAARRRPVAHVP